MLSSFQVSNSYLVLSFHLKSWEWGKMFMFETQWWETGLVMTGVIFTAKLLLNFSFLWLSGFSHFLSRLSPFVAQVPWCGITPRMTVGAWTRARPWICCRWRPPASPCLVGTQPSISRWASCCGALMEVLILESCQSVVGQVGFNLTCLGAIPISTPSLWVAMGEVFSLLNHRSLCCSLSSHPLAGQFLQSSATWIIIMVAVLCDHSSHSSSLWYLVIIICFY